MKFLRSSSGSAMGDLSLSGHPDLSWLNAGRYLAVLLLLSSYPLSFVIPATWGWENGVLENLQVVVLLGGLLTSIVFSQKGRHRDSQRVALGAMLIWTVAAARELSWGAVFLTPTAMTETGPAFSARLLPYHGLVDTLVVLAVLASVLLFVLGRLFGLLIQQVRQGSFPCVEAGLMILAALGSTYAEGHLHVAGHLNLPEVQCQVIEEFCELVAYVALYLAQARFFMMQRARAGLYR